MNMEPWRTTTEGLSDGMTVLVTVDYNSAFTRDVIVVYAEQTEETYRFWDNGSCFYFENPRTTDNFAVVAWQPLPEPYNSEEERESEPSEPQSDGLLDLISDTDLAYERGYEGDI